MSILTQKAFPLFMQSVFSATTEKIINIMSPQSVFNGVIDYVSLVEDISQLTYETARAIFESSIEEMDLLFRNSPNRVQQFYVKHRRTRMLITPFGRVNINRTIYKDRATGKDYCYVDRKLGLPKYDRYDPCVKSMLVGLYADHNSMIKVGEIIGNRIGNAYSLSDSQEFTISRQTVHNTLKNTRLLKPPVESSPTPHTLYIMADEKYVHLNTRKNKMVKSAVLFEGIREGSRNELINKHHIMSMRPMFWETVADVIYERYDITRLKRIMVIGDGAHWIKESLKFIKTQDIKCKFLLDKFHFKQSLNRITKDKDLQSTLEETVLKNKPEIFTGLIEIIKSNNATRKDPIDQQAQYILNNQSYIRQSYRYNVNCSMESSISHTLASNFTRNPKAFSFDNIEVYVNHRMNHLNGYNIKELYLKGLYVKDDNGIKDLSTSQLDFSIFDRKKHQTKFDAKMHLNAIISSYEY